MTVVRDAHYSFPEAFIERNHRPCMACFHQVFFHTSLSYYAIATNWTLSSYLDKKEAHRFIWWLSPICFVVIYWQKLDLSPESNSLMHL